MGVADSSTALWRDALQLFERLLALDAAERQRELEQLAQSQPELHAHVMTLFGAHDAADAADFLGRGVAHDRASPHPFATNACDVGARFGAYELERRIGVGGMGEVWLARRGDGLFDGRVAVKVLHAHVAQSAARERFIREGRILAQLAHPNIARLLDAGVTGQGVLFLVLEYVEGQPIDLWCDERRLDPAARLRLFLQACGAVAHAHAHLIVHRDLKPSNILVTGDGQIKLLDFGVAKLLETDHSAAETELTRLSGRALTPDFAAPEQILGMPVSTAVDVYALGVLLYVLLCGRPPWRRQHMSARELEQHAAATEPPGLKLHGDDAAIAMIAAQRGSTAQRLSRTFRGDLNTIVAKALHVEADHRYSSVEQFAADVERYLEGRPIAAAPDAWTYRARKFIQRHALGVAAGAASTILIVSFVAAMYVQTERTARERNRAEQVSTFLVELFELSDPYKNRGGETTARELLDAGAQQIETRFVEQPETRAELFGTIGRVYNRLGLARDAESRLSKALAQLRELHGSTHPDIATTLNELGVALAAQGRHTEAEQRLQDALRMRRTLFGAESVEAAESLMDLGRLALESSNHGGAERYFRDSLALYERAGMRDQPQAALVMNELGSLLVYVGRYPEATDLLRRALDIDRRGSGVDHPRVIMETHNLAFALQMQGDFTNAEELFDASNEQARRVLGPEHPYVIDMLANYGRFLRRKGELESAEAVLRQVIALNARVRGPEHTSVATSKVNLAILLHDAGRIEEAEAEYRAALDVYAKALPPDHSAFSPPLAGLARVLVETGRLAEALPLLQRALAISSATMPPESPTLAIAKSSLAAALLELGAYDEAAPLSAQSHDIILNTQAPASAVARQARATRATLERISEQRRARQ